MTQTGEWLHKVQYNHSSEYYVANKHPVKSYHNRAGADTISNEKKRRPESSKSQN